MTTDHEVQVRILLGILKEAEELLNDHYADIDDSGNANGAMRLAMEMREVISKAEGKA